MPRLPLVALLLFASTVSAADPRVGLRPAHGIPLDNRIEGIAPPVIERGKTTRVTFTGRDFGTAKDLWHSLPGGEIRATPVESKPDRIVMDLSASADAPVGVCGIRLATQNGLTNAALLMIDDLPVRKPEGGSLPVPSCVWGTFGEATRDRFTVDVAAGERLGFEVVSNRLGKDADPLLTIRDAAGRMVIERDNDPGLYFDCRFEHRFEAAGRYTVEVRDARYKAAPNHHYVIRVGRFPGGRVAVPSAVEAGFTGEVRVSDAAFELAMPRSQLGPMFATLKRPGDHGSTWVPVAPSLGPITVADDFDEARDTALAQAASGPASLAFLFSPGIRNPFLPLDRSFTVGRWQATPATIPGTLCGTLKQPGRTDAFRLRLAKGERIFVRGEARSLNSPVDLELAIVDKSGREQRRAGENNQTREEASFDFTAPTTDDYALLVRDVLRDGSAAHAYRVAVRHAPFPPQLTAEVEGLTVPQGSHQPVPIAVNRNGFNGAIKLHLVGGPTGLKLVPDVIGEKDSAVVCRLVANRSAPLGVHTVQIVAEAGDHRTLATAKPLIDMKWQNVDLIPLALREDQSRLPFSLADRFAVQIAPPSPFEFELASEEILLPRYQKAAIPLTVSRAAGFDGRIAFDARGGQLAEKSEGRTRVYAEIPDAKAGKDAVNGEIVSKILSNVGKARIEVTATSHAAGRRVQLTRTFQLDLVTAFGFETAPVKVSLLPGERTRVRVPVKRVKSFDGPVTLHFQSLPGVTLPESVMVAKGQASVEIEIGAEPDAQPRKQGITVTATGDVDGFEEELRGSPIEIEVRKVEKK
jgi:hypothetical protein